MAQCSYEDEDGAELWTAADGEFVPPGALVTAPDGERYLAVRASAIAGAPTEALRITVRRMA
ncbi:MAG TPA: hypothetical protein VJ831_03250 [Jatrophihabitantaceae bacterium]|nr:hypothetical protein [Jatrophihabitantaceae bacterium]